MTIRCEIVSQDRIVYQNDVDMVVLPGAAGQMGIIAPSLTAINGLELWNNNGQSKRE